MNRMIVAGNWKMHTTAPEASALCGSICDHQMVKDGMGQGVEVVLCPPFTSIAHVVERSTGSGIHIGAQDCHQESHGAYTGDISAPMIKASGCSYVIIGHSERRQYHLETDELIARKILAALSENLVPLFCVGETLAERESEATASVITRQVQSVQQIIGSTSLQQCVIAYEPVWAIGTGRAASPDQAQEVHTMIASLLQTYDVRIPILYGGSVNADNAASLFARDHISGALVGGASLKVEAFAAIIAAAGDQML